jgi:hypothetical protein
VGYVSSSVGLPGALLYGLMAIAGFSLSRCKLVGVANAGNDASPR